MNSNVTLNDLNALLSALDVNISEITASSTVEALELYESLSSLKSNIQTQRDKVIAGITPHRTVVKPKYSPALALAHDERSNATIVMALNALQHPLFMRGDIAVRDVK